MIKKITRNSALILIPAAIGAAFLPWENLPFSILVGGLLGLLNLRALAWTVKGTIGAASANAKMLFLSQFRFVILAVIVLLLAYLRLVSLLGIMAGFSIVFFQVLFVGHRNAGTTEENS